MSGTKALVAELLGSFVLLFGGGLAILSSNGNLLVISFGFGMALLAALYAFGERSGGHFNPAVSVSAFLDRRIDGNTLVGYVGAQVSGYLFAGLALLIVSSQDEVAATATHRPESGDVSFYAAYLMELTMAAVFVAVILRVTKSDMYGRGAFVAIALTLVMINLATSRLTGASVNPARSLGSALFGARWTDVAIWLTAPMIGGAVGWVLYRAVHEGE